MWASWKEDKEMNDKKDVEDNMRVKKTKILKEGDIFVCWQQGMTTGWFSNLPFSLYEMHKYLQDLQDLGDNHEYEDLNLSGKSPKSALTL